MRIHAETLICGFTAVHNPLESIMELEKDAIFGIQFTSGAPPCHARNATNFKRLYDVQVGIPADKRTNPSAITLGEIPTNPASWVRISVAGGPKLQVSLATMIAKGDHQLRDFMVAVREDGIDDPLVILAAATKLALLRNLNPDAFHAHVTEHSWQGKNAIIESRVMINAMIGIAASLPNLWLQF